LKFQVAASFQHITVQKHYPTISYFKRFFTNSLNSPSFRTSRRIAVRNDIDTLDEDLKIFEADTAFDYMYTQYFEYLADFGFDGSTDSIYRFAQGALFTSNFDQHPVGHMRFNSEKIENNFPEYGGIVRDLTLVHRNRKGVILKKYGVPVVALLESATDNSVELSFPRFLGKIETEMDFVVAIVYRPDVDQTQQVSARSFVRSVKKLHFEQFTFNQILDVSNVEVSRKAIRNFLDELDFASMIYDQRDQLQLYGLGKVMTPGDGLSSFILHASGAPGAAQLDRKVLAVAQRDRAVVICLGTPDVDDRQLMRALNGAFRALQIRAVDLLGMINEASVSGSRNLFQNFPNLMLSHVEFPDFDISPIRFEWKPIVNLNILRHLKGGGFSRAQLDQLIYATLIHLSTCIPMTKSAQIAAGVDGALSSLMRVFHPRSTDPTVLGKFYQFI